MRGSRFQSRATTHAAEITKSVMALFSEHMLVDAPGPGGNRSYIDPSAPNNAGLGGTGGGTRTFATNFSHRLGHDYRTGRTSARRWTTPLKNLSSLHQSYKHTGTRPIFHHAPLRPPSQMDGSCSCNG